MESYLDILENSLQKKAQILDRIQIANQKQLTLLEKNELDLEKYDAYVDEKAECIEALNKLDEGFELLYRNIAEELQKDRAKYAIQISRLQQLIREVTEKSVTIQAQETRNKDKVTAYFSHRKQELKHARVSSRAAFDYYQSMNNLKNVEAQFMDQKK